MSLYIELIAWAALLVVIFMALAVVRQFRPQ